MHDLPSDPVRKARCLFELARSENDPIQIIYLTAELRKLGRPDLAIEVLDSQDSRIALWKEVLVEKVFSLQALGYLKKALEVVSSLKKLDPGNFDVLEMELSLTSQLGGEAILGYKYQEIFSFVNNESELKRLSKILPLASLSLRDFLQFCSIAFRIQGVRVFPKIAHFLWARLKILFSRLVVGLCISLCRWLTAKEAIYFSSMGKFARLADLVDRVDPLLRRVKFDSNISSYQSFVFIFGGYPNRQFLKMYNQHCTIVWLTNGVTYRIGVFFIHLLRLADRFTEITTDYRQNNLEFLNKPKVISFSDAEGKEFRKQMERAGIDPGKPFICFGIRDMAYYEYYGEVMKIPLTNQGKRSLTHHRCPPLETYIRFALYWAERGYQVVRMGLKVSESLPKDLHPHIVDYAAGDRTDELDVFLLAHCWFLTAGDTGLFSGAAAFDQPTLVSDLFLIRNTIYSSNKKVSSIFVPKLIRDRESDRLLSFREQIFFNHVFSYYDECEKGGFEIIHNTPDDVIDASIELVERMAGTYEITTEDAALQKAFHEIYSLTISGISQQE